MLFKSFQQCANTSGGKGNARIRRAVVEVEGVAIGSNGVATWKHDVAHIATLLITFFWTKDPLITAL